MNLLIVESPSKAKTINSYLGKDFKVISSYGHVRSLPSQAGSVDPEQNFKMSYEIIDRAKKNVSVLVAEAKKADKIYLATDPDREGEAISWHINEILKQKKINKAEIFRVVFYEITAKAVKKAINNPRKIDNDLVQAQQSRQASDYLVGFTLSPVLWRKLPGSRSAGRVQSVALRVVCERENEIEKFNSQEYWSINGDFFSNGANFSAFLTHYNNKKLEKFDISNKDAADEIVKKCKNLSYSIDKIEKKRTKRNPQAPFTTSTMLQEAARKLGFSAKKTSKLAQDLYEGFEIGGESTGLITYMRTDSVTVSDDAIMATRSFISSEFGGKYLPSAIRQFKTKTKNAQEAHEAIRPIRIDYTPQKLSKYLSADHLKLYELIYKRMVASQMQCAEIDNVAADIASSSGDTIFRATGSTIFFDGFLKLYREGVDDKDDDKEQKLPELVEGKTANLNDVAAKQHFTQPPPRYTEASLVKKMEELGIGRPSTYPTIISILQEREYVKVEKKRFFPETKGRIVNAFLSRYFSQYVDYNFTANLEDELDEVSNGKLDWLELLRKFWVPFKKRTEEVLEYQNSDIVKEIEKELEAMIFGADGSKSCPSCKDGILGLKTGKFGSFVGCSNYPECKHTKQLSRSDDEDDKQQEDQAEGGAQIEFPKALGENPEGTPVSLRKGPYGVYVQLGEGKEVKRASLPKGKNAADIDLEAALDMLKLPRKLGTHPETGSDVNAGIGRFGPYVEHQKKFKSIKDDDPMTITLEKALEYLAQPAKPRFNKKTKK